MHKCVLQVLHEKHSCFSECVTPVTKKTCMVEWVWYTSYMRSSHGWGESVTQVTGEPFMLVWVFFLFLFYFLIIMHQLVKLTDTIRLLQLVISSPLIHALGDLSHAPTRIRTQVPSFRGGWLTNWAMPYYLQNLPFSKIKNPPYSQTTRALHNIR